MSVAETFAAAAPAADADAAAAVAASLAPAVEPQMPLL